VKEIDSVDLEQKAEGNQIPLPSFDDLKSLPYLNAVIDETLRLRPVAGKGLERQLPADVVLGGYAIPKNTNINCFLWGSHMSDKYWYKPHEFMPERWLDGAEHPADHDAYFPFSIGSRNCIGKNFAWMEARLGLFALLKYFEIGLVPGQEAIVEDLVEVVTLRIKVGKYDITVKERATRA
jgi:cytochrome P450